MYALSFYSFKNGDRYLLLDIRENYVQLKIRAWAWGHILICDLVMAWGHILICDLVMRYRDGTFFYIK